MTIQEQLRRLAEQKAMDKAKKSVEIALAQKRRLRDELERRKLLSPDRTRLIG